ncbi:MAG: hypothetical protein ABI068_11740, partial [Ktedonobacterales bacterium]
MDSNRQPDQTQALPSMPWRSSYSPVPSLVTDDAEIDLAFRIALGDLVSSIAPFKDRLLEEAAPVFLAGLGYEAPWTRDAAINVWNGAGLLYPDVARNTLLSVVTRLPDQGEQFALVGQYDQYWDAIIWAIGAWNLYLFTPLTGELYGGVQEKGGVISDEWRCCPRQTWSATGYLRVILRGVLGMRFEPQGIRLRPRLLAGMQRIELRDLPYRAMRLHIVV